MKFIVDSQQMKELDRHTIQDLGVPAVVLMERASLSVVEELKKNFNLERVLVICGSGNNGGDGIAIARLLHLAGFRVDLFMAGKKEAFTEETKMQWKIAGNYGISMVKNFSFPEYTTIVDAIFGVGLSRQAEGSYYKLIERMNDSHVPVLAVDIPSGIHGTTGAVMGAAVHAAETVTFAYGKTGLYLYPGAEYAGKVVVKDIGIYSDTQPLMRAITDLERSWLPRRRSDGNKGTFGKVLIAAGSRNMSGAAYFASKACLRMGAGMVKIFTEESNRIILQQQFPEAMLATYKEGERQEILQKNLKEAHEWADVAAVGPGLGTGKEASLILRGFLEMETDKPLVIDADGLNLLSIQMELLKDRRRPCILTPHMGEMARLSKKTVEELKAAPLEALAEFQREYPVAVILKDARTMIRLTDGTCYLNLTGNSGMATAGSGDTLTGMTAALLAQKLPLDQAAPLAVWLHGKAGDLAAERMGQAAMMASDILEAIPAVLLSNQAAGEDK